MSETKTVFVVGAGFSKNAGLPIQSEFTELMLAAVTHRRGNRRRLMPALAKFVKDIFGYDSVHPICQFPELEDIFTTIDLSANTGHNLGPEYASQHLRKVRRILLSNIIRMLNAAYLDGKKKNSQTRGMLLELLKKIDYTKHQFVSLNWDVVLESCLEEIHQDFAPFYSNEINPVTISDGTVVEVPRQANQMLVAKMHGSINWLYCDCCRRTFSIPTDKTGRLAYQVLNPAEAVELFPDDSHIRLMCPRCVTVDLSVRLATFSYQKAMRTPMFESSWLEAENALRQANKWVFIGYSLPAADFEFKYLLKRVQLAMKSDSPIIQVVTKSDKSMYPLEDDPTVLRYKKFFGEQSGGRDIDFFGNGLSKCIDKIL
jgi:hypothetical protein